VRPSIRRLAIVALVLGTCLAGPAAADVAYLYDDLGRLARVIAANGQAATYRYDAVGNILSITRETGVAQTSTVTTTSVGSVVRGSCTAVSVTGTNLIGASLTSPATGITFENIHSTLDGLTFDVCAGDTATTGATTIQVIGLTTPSVAVTVGQEPPAITAFAPTSGAVGDTVTISGHGFDPVPTGNTVRFNGTLASVTSAATTSVVTRVPDGAQTGPISVTTAGGTSTSTQTFTVTAAVPRVIARLDPPFLFPQDMKISADGRRAYVVNQSRDNVSVIDTATHSIIATMPAGVRAGRAIVTPDGSRLYVLNLGAVSLSVFDAVTNQPLTTIPLLAANVAAMAMTPDGRNLLVTHPSNDAVSLVDTATNTVAALIPVGRQPIFISASPDNQRVHVHNSLADTISVVDVPSRSVTATIASGSSTGFPTFGVFNPAGSRYYSDTNGNRVIAVNTATNAVTTITGFGSTRAGALSADGSRLYVGDANAAPFFDAGIVVLNTTTNTIVASAQVGPTPSSVALTPDGLRLVAINSDDNTTTLFDTTTNTVASVVPSHGATPILTATLPGNRLAYVLNRDSDTVSVIDVVANAALDAPIARNGAPLDFLGLTPDGRKLFGAAGFISQMVAGLDTQDNHALPNTTIPRSPARPVAQVIALGVDPVTGGVLYADNSRTPLWIVNTATNVLAGSIPKSVAGGTPRMRFNADGSRLLVFGTGVLSLLDTVNRTQLAFLGFSAADVVSNAARTALYVPGTNSVRVVDPNTATVTATISTAISPNRLALTGDNARLVAINTSSPTIAIIDTSTQAVVATLTAGGSSFNDIAASPTARQAFLANTTNKRIDIIDLTSNAITGSVPLANAADFVVPSRDGKFVYAVQAKAGIVAVIDPVTATVATTITIPVGSNGLRRPIAAPNGRLYVPNRDFDAMFVIE
jgi:YVTN family beta-propeller protein/YD repeat-containing protein